MPLELSFLMGIKGINRVKSCFQSIPDFKLPKISEDLEAIKHLQLSQSSFHNDSSWALH